MGSVCSCFERWGRRYPDGPLLKIETGKSKRGGLLASLSTASTLSDISTAGSLDGTNAVAESVTAGKVNAAGAGEKGGDTARLSRRRPTYSASKKEIERGISSTDEIDDDDISEEEDNISASDVRQIKLAEYRRSLTNLVKLKTSIFSEKVKVTSSKDGMCIEWFKGKDGVYKGRASGSKKPAGSFLIGKITAMKAKSDNPKALDLSVEKGSGFETYCFVFKTVEQRDDWEVHLESLRK